MVREISSGTFTYLLGFYSRWSCLSYPTRTHWWIAFEIPQVRWPCLDTDCWESVAGLSCQFSCLWLSPLLSREGPLTKPEERNRYLTYTSDMMELSRDGRVISQWERSGNSVRKKIFSLEKQVILSEKWMQSQWEMEGASRDGLVCWLFDKKKPHQQQWLWGDIHLLAARLLGKAIVPVNYL